MIDCKESGRAYRRKTAHKTREHFESIISTPFSFSKPIIGQNLSKQYNGELVYDSILGGYGSIKIEISIREKLLLPTFYSSARCLLVDPLLLHDITFPALISCYSKIEAYAEKIRALFTRKEVASRDVYDIFYAVNNNIISIDDFLIDLAKKKIAVKKECTLHTPEIIIDSLKKNINGELKPVLREIDLKDFDIMNAEDIIKSIYQRIALK